MVVGIIGSRDWPEKDLPRVAEFVRKLARKYPEAIVVSGGARGVDTEAELRARAFGLELISYRVYAYRGMGGKLEYSINTVTHGDRAQEMVVGKHRRISPPFFPVFAGAAHHRNGWIVDDCDQLVAFWDGASSGTRGTLDKAALAARPVHLLTKVATGA